MASAWVTRCLRPAGRIINQSAYYNTYDVTSLIRREKNAVGAIVADDWYSGYIGFGLVLQIGTEHTGRDTYGKTPAFMAQLEIEYADGTRETVKGDGNGPVRNADFLMGEAYEARKEMAGWDQPVRKCRWVLWTRFISLTPRT